MSHGQRATSEFILRDVPGLVGWYSFVMMSVERPPVIPMPASHASSRTCSVLVFSLVVFAGSAFAERQENTSRQPSPAFVGKAWVSSDPAAAPGTFRIFLPDGTLVMDSCGETHRFVRWRVIDDRKIEWQEDGARIQAEITQDAPDQLKLRLRPGRELREEHYRVARVPFTCPDVRPPPSSRASGAPASGAPARNIVTPSPGTYRCGDEVFKIAFEELRAFVTMPDGSLVTLFRRTTGGGPERPRTFSNGRLTFVQEIDGVASRVLFARGRMSPSPCTRQ
jgi:hypothetical protein